MAHDPSVWFFQGIGLVSKTYGLWQLGIAVGLNVGLGFGRSGFELARQTVGFGVERNPDNLNT